MAQAAQNSMSDARARILARVGAGLGRPLPEAVQRPARDPAPMALAVQDRVADFCTRAEALQSSVERVASLDAVPAALARYLAAQGLPGSGVMWPEFASLDWSGSGLAMEARPPTTADRLGLTGAFCGIAETGTLLLHSGPQRSATTSLLPETHVAVLASSRIFTRMEEAFAAVRQECGVLPRALNFVSGPSRTADIEQTIVIGAHGPRRVHVLLVGQARDPSAQ
jgi:L-lactate dehydrogenase complex protein LldG